ncbi:hypothetical protein COV88_02365 [Candidatus Saccharibacteria bacterium CG11_big_fil_rev_8_21_14_0_20_41_19]|nr:hypothetical protein [Candidatus Saccharibacteria bacterium]OIP86069.1 MAG: hypothetical protein AUK57_02030 [Candidatus Saccharibacteria bacterium CG2_30_41_52]PIQ70739.1 MAG: hypothetical protein COV88_02365 [Candidatus Saccharibacteria bacterium CG11_big_fil_rev_8_21_14_0_20_41_19]PIZ60258.1 MAG: hypothetical protein COY18_01520 [Candidatus Saccharibacteria bacterium CG_4_10_14_0_2_um_filter_41_11]PJC30010.1 MAG: hypothetical protein CO052_00100 [Candidatus Saccharibacteria bacterium CG_4
MKKKLTVVSLLALINVLALSAVSYAQPYGVGLYSENVPYGSETSLTISTDAVGGNVAIPTITPIDGGALGTATNIVTVTSTDVMGYKLYIGAATSTSMDNLGTPLLTSANAYSNPATNPLEDVNRWGYNVDGSIVNFCGMPLDSSRQLIKTVTTPISGDNTTITYGMKIDMAKPAGNYSVGVVYTAVPQTN